MLKDNIARLRQEQSLSQDELAAQVHVVRQTVSKWERGASVPDADTLRALAKALGTTPNELLEVSIPPVADIEVAALEASLLKEQLAQKNRSETIYRYTVGFVAAICAITLVAAAACAVAFKANQFVQGVEHGFGLEGSYATHTENGGVAHASFGLIDDDNGLWQLADLNDNSLINGRFNTTSDPNLFELQSEAGEPVGWASLAYAGSTFGQVEGLLYLQLGNESFQMEKQMQDILHYDSGKQFTALTVYRRNANGRLEANGHDWAQDWFTK